MGKIENKPEIKPDMEKATIILFRAIHYGQFVAINNWIDGKFAGQTKGYSYFVIKTEPGKHCLVAEAGSTTGSQTGCAKINVEANKIYYLWQQVAPGPAGLMTGYSGSNPKDFEKQLGHMDFTEIDSATEKPVFEEKIYKEAIARYEKDEQEDSNRHKDTENLQGY
jgi:hypothetical protein